jgi:hypothetical protein
MGKRLEYSLGYSISLDGISKQRTLLAMKISTKTDHQNSVQAKLGINITDNFQLSPCTGTANSKEIMMMVHLPMLQQIQQFTGE